MARKEAAHMSDPKKIQNMKIKVCFFVVVVFCKFVCGREKWFRKKEQFR